MELQSRGHQQQLRRRRLQGQAGKVAEAAQLAPLLMPAHPQPVVEPLEGQVQVGRGLELDDHELPLASCAQQVGHAALAARQRRHLAVEPPRGEPRVNRLRRLERQALQPPLGLLAEVGTLGRTLRRPLPPQAFHQGFELLEVVSRQRLRARAHTEAHPAARRAGELQPAPAQRKLATPRGDHFFDFAGGERPQALDRGAFRGADVFHQARRHEMGVQVAEVVLIDARGDELFFVGGKKLDAQALARQAAEAGGGRLRAPRGEEEPQAGPVALGMALAVPAEPDKGVGQRRIGGGGALARVHPRDAPPALPFPQAGAGVEGGKGALQIRGGREPFQARLGEFARQQPAQPAAVGAPGGVAAASRSRAPAHRGECQLPGLRRSEALNPEHQLFRPLFEDPRHAPHPGALRRPEMEQELAARFLQAEARPGELEKELAVLAHLARAGGKKSFDAFARVGGFVPAHGCGWKSARL